MVERDEHHEAALDTWRRLEETGARLFTTPLVIAETVTVFGRAYDREFAAREGRKLLTSIRLTILRPALADELAAIDELDDLGRSPDRALAYVDCVSFAVMRASRIMRAFTFDVQHFGAAGFRVIPPV